MSVVLLSLPAGSRPVLGEQSLADAARTEAARRERVRRLGIEETVIEGNGGCYSGIGNVTLFELPRTAKTEKASTESTFQDRGSLSRIRSRLQKLDRNIRQEEVRLEKMQDRIGELRRDSYRISNISKIPANEESKRKTLEQIEESKDKLRALRRERSEIYDNGRKQGFLPGELQGRGIIP
jgi:chromosome segregation ATPase